MRKILLCIGCVSLLAISSPASAATIIFDICSDSSLCNQLTLNTTLSGGAIDVNVSGTSGYGIFGDTGNNRAFGININGSGVSFSNISSGFTFGGTDQQINGYGFFEYYFDGPHTGTDALLPLTFTVSRTGGFLSDLDLFETNAAGYLAAAHLRNNQTGLTGFVAADDLGGGGNPSPIPEPGTMLLVSTGLLAAWRARRA